MAGSLRSARAQHAGGIGRGLILLSFLAAACGPHGYGDDQPAGSGPTHVVRRGESLFSIAEANGLSLQQLASANGILPPYEIYVDQELALAGGQVAAMPARTLTVEPGPAVSAAPSASIQVAQLEPLGGPATAPSAPAAGGMALGPVPGSPMAPPAAIMQPLPPLPPAGTQPLPPAGTQPLPPAGVGAPMALGPVPTAPAAPMAVGPAPSAPMALGPLPTAPAPGPSVAWTPPPAAPSAASSSGFMWPVDGRILSRFAPGGEAGQNDGVNIEAARGTPVRAAAAGTVAYAGNELRGYGNLILIRHADGWVTAYSHLDQMGVQRGDNVQAGQSIGTVGDTGAVESPQLHFEIREGSRPTDPLEHLPPRGA